jgi:hypothetical protein
MRGLPEFNFPAFDDASGRIRAMGHSVISPAELDRAAGYTPFSIGILNDCEMQQFIVGATRRDEAAIRMVDAIALLPGWKDSHGVAGELELAKELGLRILDAETLEPMENAE